MFATATQSGITNSSGEFTYLVGEQVTFSIGALQFPSATAAAQVSPVDMAIGGSDPIAVATNIARLLQSLDIDGIPENGITIPPGAVATATTLNFDISVEEFANSTDVINLVSNSGSVTTTLISEVDAITHLEGVLDTEVSSANGVGQINLAFTTELLIGRTLVPTPIEDALRPNNYYRFDSSSIAYIVGTPGGRLSAGEFPWSVDTGGVVSFDFDSFQSGAIETLEIDSNSGEILNLQPTWLGNPDPIRSYSLSTPVTTSDFSGRTITVQSRDNTGTVEFRTNGQFELSNSRGDLQVGTFTQHPVDGISINNEQAVLVSEIVLASGTLDNGFIMKSDYGDNGIFRVEFFQTTGNVWTALHTVTR
ncbi:MAG: hypothetical protein AB8B64_21905 [Granulosicoccus sp.]